MKIFIASDHGGFEYKLELVEFLQEQGYDVIDQGPYKFDKDDDYPDFASKVAKAIQKEPTARGILICKSGGGVNIVANKFKNIRATIATNEMQAKSAINDDNAQIICFGSLVSSLDEIKKMTKIFLETNFEGGRHKRRLEKVNKIEEENFK